MSRFFEAADCILEIERQMRQLGLWSDMLPAPEALESEVPFAADHLAFDGWLQFVFLPRMKIVIEHQGGLPVKSGLAPMAEVVWQHQSDDYKALIDALRDFDRLIESA